MVKDCFQHLLRNCDPSSVAVGVVLLHDTKSEGGAVTFPYDRRFADELRGLQGPGGPAPCVSVVVASSPSVDLRAFDKANDVHRRNFCYPPFDGEARNASYMDCGTSA